MICKNYKQGERLTHNVYLNKERRLIDEKNYGKICKLVY